MCTHPPLFSNPPLPSLLSSYLRDLGQDLGLPLLLHLLNGLGLFGVEKVVACLVVLVLDYLK